MNHGFKITVSHNLKKILKREKVLPKVDSMCSFIFQKFIAVYLVSGSITISSNCA